MDSSINVDWDVEFWASRYPVADLAIYNREIGNEPFERLRGLWRWKSLHRTEYAPDDLKPFLEHARDICDSLTVGLEADDVAEICDGFEAIQTALREEGPLAKSSSAVVTPQFLIHVADSDCGYSGRFPVLDAMVARAHRTHTAGDSGRTLQDQLTYSRSSYRDLTAYFFDRCTTSEQVATLERALFVQGQTIARLRENEGEYSNIREVTVGSARDYLSEVRELAKTR